MTVVPAPVVRKSLWRAIAVTLLVALANIGLWAFLNRPAHIADWRGDIGGLAYNPSQRYQDPTKLIFPSEAELDGDIRLLSRYTKRLRTYSSYENPQIPRLARFYGMQVMAGAWIEGRAERNERELAALIALTRNNDNIDRVIVGNEVVLRGDLPVRSLIQYLDRARAQLKVPVSTAEPLDSWQRNPELIRHVDFVTVHVLPYWERVPRKDAVGFVLGQLKSLREIVDQVSPGKPIVVGEVGWPSNGDRREYAQPSIADEAHFLRDWFNVAAREHIDYYVMEAIDQPWKEQIGGRVEAYWGVFNAAREPKFAFTGTVIEDPLWPWKAGAASLLALLPMFWFARHFIRFRVMGLFFFLLLVQLSASILVWMATLPYDFYLNPLDWAMLLLLFPAQLAIILILLINGFEFTEVIWRPYWLREFKLLEPAPDAPQPFVSIHLACYNEPPEMVILTLDSLAALDYDNYEVIVLDNNTKNPEIWQPVQAHCERLGAKFRFYHLEPWPGFKAGALNYGLQVTDPRAEVVAVIDADYEVRSDWLRALTGYFHNPKVAVVQCPQAHREWQHNAFRRMTNWEYDGFFRIGMHHRNERNAIIQHGTMTMVRRSALVDTGGWSEWTICEDAELGLRLMQAGHELVYVDELMGKGLTPADFKAYKSQRSRWAFGAMQIMKARLGWMTSRSSTLTRGQRFHFLTGWFSWFGDALHLVFTLMAMLWTLGMVLAPQYFMLPMYLFLVPLIGFFLFKAAFGIILYRVRVPCSWRDTIAASVASMGLSHAIATGIFQGLWRKKGEFIRTAKSRRIGKKPNPFIAVSEELLLFLALIACIVGMINSTGINYVEGRLWIAILAAQAIPYGSALVGAWIAHRSGEAVG
ncbi:MAG: glycosyltransferase [Xanthomonadales bacterium]|nr:glycosyltransferase [Xanthomonadales bacterium]MDL1869797.1 glycosyltransferase [Gammaproteobacteria bacterium PRO6]